MYMYMYIQVFILFVQYSTVPVDGPNSSVCIVGRDSAKNSDNSPLFVMLDKPYDSRLADTPLDDDTVYDTIKYA